MQPIAFDTTQITNTANYSNPQPGPMAFAENSRHELRLEGGDGQRTGALSTGGGKPGQGVPMIAFPANLSGTQCASAVAYGIRTANTSSNGWGIQEECTHPLDCAQGVAVAQPVVHAIQAGALRVNPASGPDGVGVQADHAYTLEARAEVQAVQSAMQVRRLTPTEAERLQGFPDNYTRVPNWNGWRKLDFSEMPDQCISEGLEVKLNKKTGKWRVKDVDGPRYKALGNSMATPCMFFIGSRIDAAVSAGKAAKKGCA